MSIGRILALSILSTLTAVSANAQWAWGQPSQVRLTHPGTGLPSDLWFDGSHPTLFWNVNASGQLELFWLGDRSDPWLVREPSSSMDGRFGAGAWTSLQFTAADAGYLLDPAASPSGVVFVAGGFGCASYWNVPAQPFPAIPSAYRWSGSGGNPGGFWTSCSAMSSDILRVYAVPWPVLNTPAEVLPTWSFAVLEPM